jgi:hypothetical protein
MSHVIHTVEESVEVEIPDEILGEVALRKDSDASRADLHDAIHEHVRWEIEYVTEDGDNACKAILSK